MQAVRHRVPLRSHPSRWHVYRRCRRHVRPDAKSLSSLLTWAPGQYTCAVKCDLCAFDPDGPHCVAACPTKALTVMGGAADRELDEAKRLRSIENGPTVDVTAVAQGLSEKAEGSVNNG